MKDVLYTVRTTADLAKAYGSPLHGLLRAACEEIERLRGAMAADDARVLAATERVGIVPQGCDTVERLADEVLHLRREIERLRKVLVVAAIPLEVLYRTEMDGTALHGDVKEAIGDAVRTLQEAWHE